MATQHIKAPSCNYCGYDLSGLSYVANSIECPECGKSNPKPLPESKAIPAKVWRPSLIIVAWSLLFALAVHACSWTTFGRFFMIYAWLSAPAFGVLNWIVTTSSWIVAVRRIQRPHGGRDVALYVIIGLAVGVFTTLVALLVALVLTGLVPD